jgi:2'-5' RNA ligase
LVVIGISAWFDLETEENIRGLWRVLADAGLARALFDGPYRPHVTLGVYHEVDVSELIAALRPQLLSIRPIPIRFAGLGAFLNDPPALCLSVTQSRALNELHSRVHDLFAVLGRGPVAHYLPDAWNPHCTIALELPGRTLPQAVELLSTMALPRGGVIDRVGVIDTPAEIELEALQLGSEESTPDHRL